MENITLNWYFGNDHSMLVSNCLFCMGGAAILLSNRRSARYRSKYQLVHTVRTHKGVDDTAFGCVYQQQDEDGKTGVSLSKDLMAIAAGALKTNITTLGPLNRLCTAPPPCCNVLFIMVGTVLTIFQNWLHHKRGARLRPPRQGPALGAVVISMENITLNWYFGNDHSMLVSNCLFCMGGAAILLSNRRSARYRSKYQLVHTVRTHKGVDDTAFGCVYQQQDEDGKTGVSLSKDLMAIAAGALKTNITTLGPLNRLCTAPPPCCNVLFIMVGTVLTIFQNWLHHKRGARLRPPRQGPALGAVVISMENITLNWYFGNDHSMLVSNCLFCMGGAAILLSNRRSARYRSKYQLVHTVRTHKGVDDTAFGCVYQQQDEDGKTGVSLSKDLMAIAAGALKTNITTLGPLNRLCTAPPPCCNVLFIMVGTVLTIFQNWLHHKDAYFGSISSSDVLDTVG
ncbi:hypothetical protein ACQ4PT_030778 [Festuca glaucescens]